MNPRPGWRHRVYAHHPCNTVAQATGGEHYIETVWGRGYVLRDSAPEPAALPRADDV
jgi:hypothetical protein